MPLEYCSKWQSPTGAYDPVRRLDITQQAALQGHPVGSSVVITGPQQGTSKTASQRLIW
uniref:Uncharacterized protein n=1 Tax=Moniliophthora roreri TaxID=221103 RepID=A0A0W0FVK8_MONRR